MQKSPKILFYLSGVLCVVTAVVTFFNGTSSDEKSILNYLNEELGKAIENMAMRLSGIGVGKKAPAPAREMKPAFSQA